MQSQLCCWLLLMAIFFPATSCELLSDKIADPHNLVKCNKDNKEAEYPLPRHVKPNSYKVELQPFVLEERFQGQVEINISCHEPTDTIILHADRNLEVEQEDIDIRSIGLWDEFSSKDTAGQNGSLHERMPQKYTPHAVATSEVTRGSNKDWYEIKLKERLNKGMMYLVKLTFNGNISTSHGFGLHRFRYTLSDTNKVGALWIANMEHNHIRKVFPCFDVPIFKATIQLSVVHPGSLKAVSTMPIQSTETLKSDSSWKVDHFATSPPMAVESLGFTLFDPTEIELLLTQQVNNVTIYGYGQASARNAFIFHAEQIVSRLQVLDNYFGVSYPLPELKILAVPSKHRYYSNKDFWGLITFSDGWMELDDLYRMVPFGVLTRQWMGHMVTPDGQTEPVADGLRLCLTYVALTDVLQKPENLEDAVHPHAYYGYGVQDAINEASGWGDTIRISWIWTMLNNTLSEETFRLGIQKLMHEKAFKTFTDFDVYKALDSQAWQDRALPMNTSVQEIAKSWFDQKLYPVITITRNYEDNSAIVQQASFLPEKRPNQTVALKDHLFWVPITYITGRNLDLSSTNLSLWVKDRREVINYLPAEDTFIIVNPGRTAMFWVNYDLTNWQLVSQYLLKSVSNKSMAQIPGVTRSKLLNDAVMLAVAGKLHFSTALDIMQFMRFEKNLNSWVVFRQMMRIVSDYIYDTPVYDKFIVYCKYLVAPMYKFAVSLDLKGEFSKGVVDGILFSAAEAGYEPALTDAKTEFGLSIHNNTMIKAWFTCSVLRWSNEDWELALQFILTTNKTSDNHLSELVRCTREQKNLIKVLHLMFIDDQYEFSDSDVKQIINGIHDYKTVLEFILTHWNEVKLRLGNKPELWKLLFEKVTRKIKTEEELKLLTQVDENHHSELQDAKDIVVESLTDIKKNMNSKYRYVKEIELWLDSNLPSFTL